MDKCKGGILVKRKYSAWHKDVYRNMVGSSAPYVCSRPRASPSGTLNPSRLNPSTLTTVALFLISKP